MQITQPTKLKDIRRAWHLVDVDGKVLGRIVTGISQLLMGKSKPYFVPNLDCGDFVVVINSAKVTVTGKKGEQKMYMHYSGYPAGLKAKSFNLVQQENPNKIISEAVSGMLPQNKLRASMLKRLYVYADGNHPYKDKLSARV